ncbi:MAG: HEAT repeat domain-containing protein, partial [Bryobacteraceae bacterium]|nr:HEAT repeat domain-containing protein [Bryobacteraceae bacterium]
MSQEPLKSTHPAHARAVKEASQHSLPQPEHRADRISKLSAAELADLLGNPKATLFEKAKACQRLAAIGGKEAVPALAPLLTDPQLSHYARFGLEPNPEPAAGEALRGALRKVQGPLLVGVINSLGARRDERAVEALGRLLASPDPEVAKAAAAALGRISGLRAARLLEATLGRQRGTVREAVAAALLACAEGLLQQGHRQRAL